MKVLVFDTETTGLPIGYNPSLNDLSKWPYIIQLSFIVFDTIKKEVLEYSDHIIKLDIDCQISSESIAIHRITQEHSQKLGVPIQTALKNFTNAVKKVDLIVGHNIIFDKNMLTVEFNRNKMENSLQCNGIPIPEFCTMKETIELCKLPFTVKKNKKNNDNYKWPTLSELHHYLFNSIPSGTHNAIADVMICLRCYVYLQNGYDIAFDNDVSILFRTLYASNCLESNCLESSE